MSVRVSQSWEGASLSLCWGGKVPRCGKLHLWESLISSASGCVSGWNSALVIIVFSFMCQLQHRGFVQRDETSSHVTKWYKPKPLTLNSLSINTTWSCRFQMVVKVFNILKHREVTLIYNFLSVNVNQRRIITLKFPSAFMCLSACSFGFVICNLFFFLLQSHWWLFPASMSHKPL